MRNPDNINNNNFKLSLEISSIFISISVTKIVVYEI